WVTLVRYTWEVNPHIDRETFVQHFAPVVTPEVTSTMLTYAQKLRKEGFDAGIEQGQRKVLLRQLARRFGPLPEAITTRVARADAEDIERWSDRILDAASLDEVFAAT